MRKEVEEKPSYAVVAAVQVPSVSDIEFEASLSELRELAKTLGYKVVHTFIQKRASFDTTGYLGIGKRQEIEHYVISGEPMDKAGAYGIQGVAAMFVREIHGSYTGIVGLPLAETVELLRQFGIEVMGA